MTTYVNACVFSVPIWNIFLNLVMMLLKCGFPSQMMSSTNRVTIQTNSVWLQKKSNCDGMAPSLQSSPLTFNDQYVEASANPYTYLFKISKFCLFVLLLVGIQRYSFLNVYFAKMQF